DASHPAACRSIGRIEFVEDADTQLVDNATANVPIGRGRETDLVGVIFPGLNPANSVFNMRAWEACGARYPKIKRGPFKFGNAHSSLHPVRLCPPYVNSLDSSAASSRIDMDNLNKIG